MIEHEQLLRFSRMEKASPHLHQAFRALTRAHGFFQGTGSLKSVSVSDVLDNGSIEATFQGARIKFELLLTFAPDRSPLGRVVCMHCHCTYGQAMQDLLGTFTFGEDGVTDLEPDHQGVFPHMESDASAIVLRFLEAALYANKTM